MRKTILLWASLGILASSLWMGVCLGTVEPTLESLVKDSDWIVVGVIADVQHQSPSEDRVIITPKTSLTLKGNFINRLTKQISFLHETRTPEDKGWVDLEALKQSGEDSIFFLRAIPDDMDSFETLRLRLTDAWFGIKKAAPETIQEIRTIVENERT